MSSQDDEEFDVLRTEEANQMKKLAKYRYQKPTELKKGWIKENKEKLSKEMQETCQVCF